ncbi:MAG TPA: nitroreductase/quinone reductase family protein [Candidatus Limnocylindrales bacterium]|nr:nitroreductase/quinone reductase family protein [Candidatus Limnocylindrales bacterium]
MDSTDITKVNQRVVELFRAGGEIPGMHRERLLLLTTVGARTGQPRTTPMMFVRIGARLFVIASNAGASGDPKWYRNLLANPSVTVEMGSERYATEARPITGTERDRIWTEIKQRYPFFGDHETKVERVIPVVELTLPAGG